MFFIILIKYEILSDLISLFYRKSSMQQERPQPPVVYMHVPQAARADGQLRMVEPLVHTI